jgi:hypothetical protein
MQAPVLAPAHRRRILFARSTVVEEGLAHFAQALYLEGEKDARPRSNTWTTPVFIE